jgi:hypothetical protein
MHFFWNEGTRGSQVFCALPLFLQTFIFRVGRGRQCSRIALLQRIFGFISVLVFSSLRGSRIGRSRINIDWSFLEKMRARNKKLVVLQRAFEEQS